MKTKSVSVRSMHFQTYMEQGFIYYVSLMPVLGLFIYVLNE